MNWIWYVLVKHKALEDCRKLNDMIAQYPSLTKAKRDEFEEKMLFLKEQLEMIISKNTYR